MENYEHILTLLTSYTPEELDSFIMFLKEFKRINAKRRMPRTVKPDHHVQNDAKLKFYKELNKRVTDTRPEHETEDGYSCRRKKIFIDLQTKWDLEM